MSRPRLMFVAGETSGDHHAAAVIKALGRKAECFGLGGPAMAAAGMRLDTDLASRSVIGFVEVLRHFSYFRRAFSLGQRLLAEERPDLLVLVDYPGFNLRLASYAKFRGVPVAYYISPQVWAWKAGRVKTMARILRKMLVIFPFEKSIYDKAGLDCSLVGHPLLDAIPTGLLHRSEADRPKTEFRTLRAAFPWKGAKPVVGLLPGSRAQEVGRLLGVMLESAALVAKDRPGLRFVVVKPPAAPAGWYTEVGLAQSRGLQVEIFEGKSQAEAYAARAGFDAALVASGTATLETALLGTPFCILYRLNALSYAIGKRFVKIHSIGLANVVAGRRVVPEFLQEGLKPEAIAKELGSLLDDPARRRAQRHGLLPGLRSLGKPGVASRVAGELLALAKEAHA
ncbi:MAG TPA: lipid-A-disaccharide synthase [bacterium]|jgi:lipid-A-disaccharide synthase|nr:lipid-A-disaccharide synthase [bacterium]